MRCFCFQRVADFTCKSIWETSSAVTKCGFYFLLKYWEGGLRCFLSGRGAGVRAVRAVPCAAAIVCVVCFLLKYWERGLRYFYQAAGLACDSMFPFEILGKGFAVFLSGRGSSVRTVRASALHALFAFATVCVVCFLLKYWERGLRYFYQAAGLACDSMFPFEILGKGFAVFLSGRGSSVRTVRASALHALFAFATVCVVCFLLKYWESGLQCFLSGRGTSVR